MVPQHGTQQHMRVVQRLQLTYEAEHRLLLFILFYFIDFIDAFSALTLLVGRQEGH